MCHNCFLNCPLDLSGSPPKAPTHQSDPFGSSCCLSSGVRKSVPTQKSPQCNTNAFTRGLKTTVMSCGITKPFSSQVHMENILIHVIPFFFLTAFNNPTSYWITSEVKAPFVTYQWDPKGHSPPFRKQQVPSSSPGAHLMSHLLAWLVDQQDGDSALWGSGCQPGSRHQHLASHTVQFLSAETIGRWKRGASFCCCGEEE